MSDLSDLVGVALLFVSAGVLGVSLVFLFGKARHRQIQAAFAQVTLLPERRRTFLAFLALETGLFFATGVLFGLSQFGYAVGPDPDLLPGLLFVAGTLSMGGLAWVVLRPRLLTEEERLRAREAAPMLESLWMMPYRLPGDEANPPPAR